MSTAVKDNATGQTPETASPNPTTTRGTSTHPPQPVHAMPVHRFSTDDYLAMIDAGVLGPEDKVELIDGTICDMSPQGPRHTGDLIALIDLFLPVKDRCHFAVQSTMPFGGDRVLDPDFAVLRPRDDAYRGAYAKPEDVMLLIEVASTSQVHDREVKGPIYAKAGVGDYWIIDIPGDRVFIHRDPAGDTYGEIRMLRRGDKVTPVNFPDFELDVADILGPPPEATDDAKPG